MSQWRYVHLLFFVAFLGSWFLFALLWWLIIYYHGDFEEEHLPENQVFCLILVISTCLTYPHSHLSCCWPNHIDIFGWSSIIMETLKRNTCQRIRCLHLSHRSFLSHYLTISLPWLSSLSPILLLTSTLKLICFATNISLLSQEANNWTPCVWQINNFASVFLFRWQFLQKRSLETNKLNETRCNSCNFFHILEQIHVPRYPC